MIQRSGLVTERATALVYAEAFDVGKGAIRQLCAALGCRMLGGLAWRSIAVGVPLCAVLFAVGATSPRASAAIIHRYQSRITEVSPGSGAPLPGPVTAVNSLAVAEGGLWVAEDVTGQSYTRVDQFDVSSGAFISQLETTSSTVRSFKFGVAVGHSTGERQVYVGASQEESDGSEHATVAVFGPTGALQATWNGSDTPAGSFGFSGSIGSVAVDLSNALADWAAGDVYVADGGQGVVDVFAPGIKGGETYVAQLTGPSSSEPFVDPSYVAVSEANGDVFVFDNGALDVFAPAPIVGEYEFVRRIAGPPPVGAFGSVNGIAVDAGDGDVYVAEGTSGERKVVDEFSVEGSYLGAITGADAPSEGFDKPASVAVDPATHKVFVGDYRHAEGGEIDVFGPNLVVPDVTSGPPSNVQPTGATLNGTVNPDKAGPATCQFLWGTSRSFGHSLPCPAAIAEGETPVDVMAELAGLQPDTVYYYRLEATNANGVNPGEEWQDQEFVTPGPGLHGEWSSRVASTSATLNATLNPHGAPTSYRFEYGTTTAYGASAPALAGPKEGVPIGSGEADVQVSQHIQGLLPDTTYHYRVVAVSELGPGDIQEFAGVDRSFTTQPAVSVLPLPDGRAWEMVSPVEKHGGTIEAIGQAGGDIQAAESGDGVSYVISAPAGTRPEGNLSFEWSQLLSTRSGSGEWQTRDLATPHDAPIGDVKVGDIAEYRLFAPDLSRALVEPPGETLLSSEASEWTPYLRDNGACEAQPPVGCYRPLVTGAPGYANVPPGTKFGRPGLRGTLITVVGASPDLRHVVLSSDVPLTSAPITQQLSLYEWTDGRLALVSELPNGEPAPIPALGDDNKNGDVMRAISNDGTRVIWSAGGHLYMRDTSRSETLQIDTPASGAKGGPGEAQFRIASVDGSRVFFTDDQQLTPGSIARESEPDLYVFELTSGRSERLAGRLTDLTEGVHAAVQGDVLGASEDGSYVYFVANGVLATKAARGECETFAAPEAKCNVYLDHHGAGTWEAPKLVGVVTQHDSPDWNVRIGRGAGTTALVSSNGGYLAFMSDSSLTEYDNHDAASGEPDEEVYLYRAATGGLKCVSCNPTGARPHGVFESTEFPGPLIDRSEIWEDRWIAGLIPGWSQINITKAFYQSRYLSNEGRLFFNSADALVPQDTNGQADVYEYEPDGLGACTSIEGCVALISDGTFEGESAFLDASTTGNDVFFVTAAALTPRDVDTAPDVYDAHVCAPEAPCASPGGGSSQCTTIDACRSAPLSQPSVFRVPPSATFVGASNMPGRKPALTTRARKLARALRACRRYKARRKRSACVRRARRLYGAKRSRGASMTRRGQR